VTRRLRLRNAVLADGETADVVVESGTIAAVHVHPVHAPPPADEEHDLAGYVLLPAAAEPHAHLDKALLAERFPNPSGDLLAAVEAARRAYASMDEDDIRERATRAIGIAVAHGYTAIRTHVNCEPGIGTRGVRVLCALRDELAELVDLQVVAMLLGQITGPAGAEHRAILEDAVALGADVVGGAPELDEEPGAAVELLVDAAAGAGLPIDLHVDETTDAGAFALEVFADAVGRRGLGGRATASHCVSLGQQDGERARRTAAAAAAAGVAVVTLPQTNLWLQGRAEDVRVPRGLTAIRLLREAGALVAGGGDNWRDPFNPLGRIDPFETAQLLVAAAHLDAADAYTAVSAAPRAVMGLQRAAVSPGSTADLLAVRARSLGEAVAAADADRWVFRAGELVARTRTTREVDPLEWAARRRRRAE
jgi:cytosine deaminase